MKKPFVVAVTGPTASGKTALGVFLAQRFGGEVVSCDSMQIYKHLNIGTAKPSKEEMQGVRHHMIDIAEPYEKFSVERFCAMANECISDILSRGKLPILVGGTGLYIENTVWGTRFAAPERDEKLTGELYDIAKKDGADALYDILKKLDPQKAESLHKNDIRRVARAVETVRTTGKTRGELDRESRTEPLYDCLWIGIETDRAALYEKIEQRVDLMLKNGLCDEVRRYIYPIRKSGGTALGAIGYREMLSYLLGKCTYDEAVRLLKRNTRRYAKRQFTWFGKNTDICRISGNIKEEAVKLIAKKGF